MHDNGLCKAGKQKGEAAFV